MATPNTTHKRLTGVIGVYHSLSEAKTNLSKIFAELDRLQSLGITPKTVDRQLSGKKVNMLQNIDVLARNLESSMANHEGVTAELRGRVNSLVGFARHLQTQIKTPSRSQQAAAQQEAAPDKTQFAHAAALGG